MSSIMSVCIVIFSAFTLRVHPTMSLQASTLDQQKRMIIQLYRYIQKGRGLLHQQGRAGLLINKIKPQALDTF